MNVCLNVQVINIKIRLLIHVSLATVAVKLALVHSILIATPANQATFICKLNISVQIVALQSISNLMRAHNVHLVNFHAYSALILLPHVLAAGKTQIQLA